jgi:hypothetical protein
MAIPSFVAPSSRSFLGVGREAAGATGTPVAPNITIPIDKNTYAPEDTPHFLPDEAIRGVMAMLYNDILGVEDATFSYGGPAFLDVEGYFMDNIFGDLSTTGTGTTSSTTVSVAGTVGATQLVLASGSGYSNGSAVQVDVGSIAEVVVLSGAPSAGTVSFTNYPLRFAHATGASVAVVTGPYTHKFALLNTIGPYGNAQPPTHTFTDYTGLTASVGARSYPSACLSALDVTGNAEQLLDMKISGNSWLSAPAGTAPTATTTFVVPVPAWRSNVVVGGGTVTSAGSWALNVKRQLQVYWTAQNQQNPYIIARGQLSATGTIDYTVPSDETPLTQMLNNTQPTAQFIINNGLAGTASLALTIQASKAAFVKSKPTRNAVLVGYQDEFDCVANTTDVGGSGGLGPVTFTLTNNIPSY